MARQRKILMPSCIHILDVEKGLLPVPPSTPDQEVQSSEQDKDIKSGTDLKGRVWKDFLKHHLTILKMPLNYRRRGRK